MTCPSCGYKNEEGAKTCNLCGKLLVTKVSPPALAPAAAPRIDDAPERVPSWPNRAILCLCFTPALTLLLLPLLLHKGENEPSDADQDRILKFLWMSISGAGYLVATVPLAARMAVGPLFATLLSGLLLILGMVFNPRFGVGLSWVTLAGLGMAWYARSEFTRPWNPAKIFGWTRHGYQRLLAPDRWAWLRLIDGIALFLGGIAFMLLLGTAILDSLGLPRSVAKIMALPAFIGAFLAASGLSLSESPESK